RGATVGCVIAGKVINKDTSIVQDIRSLLQDQATFFLARAGTAGQVRVSTTRTKQSIGTLHRLDQAVGNSSYTERQAPRPVEGEEVMGVFDPVKDLDGVVMGTLYIGRPMSLINAIYKAQEDIQSGIETRRQLYVLALAAVSVIIGVVIASTFSKRIT